MKNLKKKKDEKLIEFQKESMEKFIICNIQKYNIKFK